MLQTATDPVGLIPPSAPIGAVPRYVAGRSALPGAADVAKLSSNELPFDPLPSVRTAMEAVLGGVNRYPAPRAEDLQTAVAEHVGVDPAEVAVGPGSSGVLWQLATAYLAAGDRVVLHTPNFEAYPIAVALANAEAVPVPMRDWCSDVDALAERVDASTKLVILADPHNPTGTRVGPAAARRLVEAVDGRALVLLDEAYVDFVEPAAERTGIVPSQLWREHPNVVVLRTFSKAHGLAALRVGYALAHPSVVQTLGAVAPPFAVNQVAIAAARASLSAGAELDRRVAEVCAERRRVAAALSEAGFDVPPSSANFVFLPASTLPPGLLPACEAAGVIVRPIGGDGVRVSIGAATDNDRFLEAIDGLRGAAPAGRPA